MHKVVFVVFVVFGLTGCQRDRAREGIVTCEADHRVAGVLILCQDGTEAFVPRNVTGDPMSFGCFWPKAYRERVESLTR